MWRHARLGLEGLQRLPTPAKIRENAIACAWHLRQQEFQVGPFAFGQQGNSDASALPRVTRATMPPTLSSVAVTNQLKKRYIDGVEAISEAGQWTPPLRTK